MDHLLKCHMLRQECKTEELRKYDEAAKVCLPVYEQCLVAREEEDHLRLMIMR